MTKTRTLLKLTGLILSLALVGIAGGAPSPALVLGLLILALGWGEQTPRKRRVKRLLKALKYWLIV